MARAAAPWQTPVSSDRPQHDPADQAGTPHSRPALVKEFHIEHVCRRGDAPRYQVRPFYRRGQLVGQVALIHDDTAGSLVLHHRVLTPAVVVRRVETPAGRVLEDHLIYLRRPCTVCGQRDCAHIRSAAASAQIVAERGTPPAGPAPVELVHEPEAPEAPDDIGRAAADRPYDGGWEPIYTDTDGEPGRSDIRWGIDAEPLGPHSIRSVAGADDGWLALLGPLVDRAIDRQVAFVPRLAGEREDLFQEGMITALQEVRRIPRTPGEPQDQYTARLARAVEIAVRRRMIDLIRRQDAYDRHLPEVELPDGREISDEEIDSEEHFFTTLFAPRPDEDTAITRYVRDHATGLARRIVEAVLGEGTCALEELRPRDQHGPAYRQQYLEAIQSLTRLLGEAMTAAKRGVLADAAG